MIREIELSSKEAYLAWVQKWKTEWHNTVAKIRETKEKRRFHRDEARRLKNQLGSWEYEEIQQHRDKMWEAHWEHKCEYWWFNYYWDNGKTELLPDCTYSLRQYARYLLELRVRGKELSQKAKKGLTNNS